MEYVRSPQGILPNKSQHMFQGGGYQNEDQESYDLERTAMAALQDLDAGNHAINGRWTTRMYEMSSPVSNSFIDARKADMGYPSQATRSPAQGRTQIPRQGSQMAQQQMQSMQRQNSSTSSGLTNVAVERNDYREAAEFILRSKNGNEAAALDFLRGVFLYMTNPSDSISTETHNWDVAVKNGPPYITPEDQAAAQAQLVMNQHNSILVQAQRLGVSPRPPPVIPVTLFEDEIDQRISTLVILVPGRAHIVGHLIGKGGAEVGRIEREMSVTIKIEAATKLGVQLVERSVCIIGTVASTTIAQQHVSHKVHEKLLTEGVQAEVLKMVVPNEIVRHLIGKSGANINRLQSESGARIQVEPETTMSPGSVGRTIVLQGTERCRTFAQYLILRQIAEDRNVHTEWAGRMHGATGPSSPNTNGGQAPPQSPPGNAGASMPFSPTYAPVANVRQPVTTLPVPDESGESVSFMVPESAVAFLIGRNGSSVMEIQNQTGARVHIARPNTVNGGTTEECRRVTVSGQGRSVEAAQHLIRSRVQLALNNASSPHVNFAPHQVSFQKQ